MNHRKSISLRALLLLLLAVGPLQAQTIFACAMMETVVQAPCCCNEHGANKGHGEPALEDVLDSGHEPCCERSVQVTVDQDAEQAAPVGKSAELRSGVDQPQPIVFSVDALVPPQPILKPGVSPLLPAAGYSGSDTWLITQRLRI